MVSGFRWRRPDAGDLPAAPAVALDRDGSGIVGAEVAARIWAEILRHSAFYGAVVTHPVTGAVAAFGASCFVSEEFYERETREPRPRVNDRLFAAYEAGEPVMCSRRQLAEASAGQGLIQLQLYGNLDTGLYPDEAMAAGNTLANALVALNRGYRLRASFGAVTSNAQRQFAESSGADIVDFGEGTAMYHITRASLATHPGGIGAVLFHYKPPTLRLTPSHQDLLLAALDGATDEALAELLGLSVAAVKARWRSVFERVADSAGETWVGWSDRSGRNGRGPQRRHRLIAYCREHPEELRPYAWPATGPASRPRG